MVTATKPVKRQTAGQILADTLRKSFHIGTRTSRYGKIFGVRTDLHTALVEAIENAVQLPGYYEPDRTEVYRTAWGAALSYRKHYDGYRMDPVLRLHISNMTAWQFAALLGRMVDAGVTNAGEGERFFAAMARVPVAIRAEVTPSLSRTYADKVGGAGCPARRSFPS